MAINRRTKAQKLQDENLVYDLMMKGWTPHYIIKELMENYNYATETNCRKIIDTVNQKFITRAEKDKTKLIQRYLDMYQEIYKQSVEKGERHNAKQALDSIVKLEGLLVDKIEAKIDNVYKIEF